MKIIHIGVKYILFISQVKYSMLLISDDVDIVVLPLFVVNIKTLYDKNVKFIINTSVFKIFSEIN